METLDGYGIQNSILYETGHGFVLAHAKDRIKGFMVLQFTETPFGRDFYHGRSFALKSDAERDYRRRADNYGYLYKAVPRSRQKPAQYCRYYSTQRPVDIGTYPKPDGNEPIVIINYDCDRHRPVAGGRLSAWGELTYREPLAEEQAEAYELVPAPGQITKNNGIIFQNFSLYSKRLSKYHKQ